VRRPASCSLRPVIPVVACRLSGASGDAGVNLDVRMALIVLRSRKAAYGCGVDGRCTLKWIERTFEEEG
jgi:hypothetical protein